MKKIILISLILLVGCSETELPLPEEKPITNTNIFSVNESSVTNGQSIYFNLSNSGTYTLTLMDKQSSQVISKERFVGQGGENVRKIYTKTLPKGKYELILHSSDKKEVYKTDINVN
jgi:hypothetical protein